MVGGKREESAQEGVNACERERKRERDEERGRYGAGIYPWGVIVVRCMVIGRLAASILTTREPQITRKLKLPRRTGTTASPPRPTPSTPPPPSISPLRKALAALPSPLFDG